MPFRKRSLSAASGGGSITFQPDLGTSPVVDSSAGTLTITSSDSSVSITGNSGTDTIDIKIAASGSAINRSINIISTPQTLGSTALTDYVYFVSGTTTVTMPTAVSNTNRYTIKNTGVATVTVNFTGVETADGSTSLSLPVSNTSLDLVSDNTNWRIC